MQRSCNSTLGQRSLRRTRLQFDMIRARARQAGHGQRAVPPPHDSQSALPECTHVRSCRQSVAWYARRTAACSVLMQRRRGFMPSCSREHCRAKNVSQQRPQGRQSRSAANPREQRDVRVANFYTYSGQYDSCRWSAVPAVGGQCVAASPHSRVSMLGDDGRCLGNVRAMSGQCLRNARHEGLGTMWTNG
jgi:hypothetical protein